MANLKLTNDYWETSGVYDFKQKKTQRVINDDVITKIGTTTMGTTATTLTGAIKELNDKATSLQGQISAYVETTDTASRAYSVGQYVVWKGTLYRVTSSITNGGTITSSKLTAVTATAEISGKAPTNHASTATTYGKGTSTNYGHVKISDSLTDTTTAATGGVVPSMKAVSDLNGAINDRISDASTTNLLDIFTKTNGTVSGVTITWLGDGSVKASGTSSETNWNTVYQSTTQMPSGIAAGQTYKASMKTSNEKMYLMVLAYTGSWTVVLNTSSSTPVSFTVPSNATGFWIRVNIQGGYTFSNAIAKPVIYAADALSGAITSQQGQISEYVETTNKASRSYVKGDRLVYNGSVYVVTTPIDQNATLTVGTNITAETIGQGLTNISNCIYNRNVAGHAQLKVTRQSGAAYIFFAYRGNSSVNPCIWIVDQWGQIAALHSGDVATIAYDSTIGSTGGYVITNNTGSYLPCGYIALYDHPTTLVI